MSLVDHLSSCRVGLALGGGGARGWAHLGAIRALREHGIQPAAIAGTSIGALIGGFLAADKLDVLEELIADLDLKRILYLFAETNLPRAGLVDGHKIIDLIREKVGGLDIADLPTPYRAVATDIETGEEVVLDHGDLVLAIRASIAIPGVFSPVSWEGRHLADGGLVNPLPIHVVRGLDVEAVIAVDLHGGWRHANHHHDLPSEPEAAPPATSANSAWAWLDEQRERLEKASVDALRKWIRPESGPSIISVLTNTIDIVSAHRTREELSRHPADLLIQPDLGAIGHMEFHRVSEAMDAGYEATLRALDGSIS